jgi:hypothetical protein
MPPPIFAPQKTPCHRHETLVIGIKDYDDNLLQFTHFLWGVTGVKGKKRRLTALTALSAHIFVA